MNQLSSWKSTLHPHSKNNDISTEGSAVYFSYALLCYLLSTVLFFQECYSFISVKNVSISLFLFLVSEFWWCICFVLFSPQLWFRCLLYPWCMSSTRWVVRGVMTFVWNFDLTVFGCAHDFLLFIGTDWPIPGTCEDSHKHCRGEVSSIVEFAKRSHGLKQAREWIC